METNEKLDSLIRYAESIAKAGLESKQNYYRFIKVCDEIEKELGLNK